VKGSVALSSQSGGVGMAIIGFSRSAKMGVSAIVGLGNKADIDEDDLLTFFEQDDATKAIAMHMEDLKDGRAFAEVAKRVSKAKPVMVLKPAARRLERARRARHTGALAGNDKVYDDVLRQSGVIRARGLNETARVRARGADPADAQGRKRRDHHRRRRVRRAALRLVRRCRTLADEVRPRPRRGVQEIHPAVRRVGESGRHHRRRTAQDVPEHDPAGTRGRPDPRAGNWGYWHTIVTPPMVFARLCAEVVEEFRARGINKPVVASLAGDVEVEEASEYLFDHKIPAIPTIPRHRSRCWARNTAGPAGAGLL